MLHASPAHVSAPRALEVPTELKPTAHDATGEYDSLAALSLPTAHLNTFTNRTAPYWVKHLVVALSFLSPVAAPRAEGQDISDTEMSRVTKLIEPTPLERLTTFTVPSIKSSTHKIPENSPDFRRFMRASAEHDLIFGEGSNVLLVWPDHYLSYEPHKGSNFNSSALREHLEAVSRETAFSGTYANVKYDDAVSAVNATTSFVGPAAFSLSDHLPDSPPLVAVVGFDSSRPRSIALRSLAGINCPTVMLTRTIAREDLHSFVRLHESGHALQHTDGRVKDSGVETSYERCIIESEADVFATLWWLKTRNGDNTVPMYFAHLRNSNYFEHAARSCGEMTIQYATQRPLFAALEVGAHFAKQGTLSAMSAEEIYVHAQKIVMLSLPPEPELRDTTRSLKETMRDLWQNPFKTRLAMVTETLKAEDTPAELRSALTSYLESATFLTDTKHLENSFPELSHLTLTEKAEQIWVQELIDDLQFSVTPSIVVERYASDLAAAALATWRLTNTSPDGDQVRRVIQIDGAPDMLFVPTSTRERYLEIAKRVLGESAQDR